MPSYSNPKGVIPHSLRGQAMRRWMTPEIEQRSTVKYINTLDILARWCTDRVITVGRLSGIEPRCVATVFRWSCIGMALQRREGTRRTGRNGRNNQRMLRRGRLGARNWLRQANLRFWKTTQGGGRHWDDFCAHDWYDPDARRRVSLVVDQIVWKARKPLWAHLSFRRTRRYRRCRSWVYTATMVAI